MKKVYVKRYPWANTDWVINLKMHGPDAMPVLIREKTKKDTRSMSHKRQDALKDMSKY